VASDSYSLLAAGKLIAVNWAKICYGNVTAR
jgi:hypothetical protein